MRPPLGSPIRKHIHYLTPRQPPLHALPEFHRQQVAVSREKGVAQLAGWNEEGTEFFREHVVLPHEKPRLRGELVLR